MEKFQDLVKRVAPEILLERYYKYVLPKDPETKLYDFYVLSYLKSIINQPSDSFRDLKPDLVDSVNDAIKTCFTDLRTHLLDVIFYSICAEMRHADNRESNRNILNKETLEGKVYMAYLKYFLFHRKDQHQQKELIDIMNVRKPISRTEIPEKENVSDQANRNTSFKAAHYAIKKLKTDRSAFVRAASILFGDGGWDGGYGGTAWKNIADGWLLLNNSNEIDPSDSGPKQKMSLQDKHDREKKEAQEKLYGKYFDPNDLKSSSRELPPGKTQRLSFIHSRKDISDTPL